MGEQNVQAWIAVIETRNDQWQVVHGMMVHEEVVQVLWFVSIADAWLYVV